MLEVERLTFGDFHAVAEPRLRVAFGARYGDVDGRDATAEALAYAWEHWDRVRAMDNPVGYLFRVGESKTRRIRRRTPVMAALPPEGLPEVEPGLPAALSRLPERQRMCVVLATGLGWTYREVGELLDVSPSTVETHVRRGLEALRRRLGVES
ncbi:sigma-70 family RNA polymerase sigma factor [Demequina pelophila]|uniref:sigma-70 family RNA polymerase sigma factor n=1 Tax=Demequina pelophila TaxID=1638984 RepID=UPI000781C805|nr:sigma-70 family RNA polymerase sigma factor [Demequina pelophila]